MIDIHEFTKASLVFLLRNKIRLHFLVSLVAWRGNVTECVRGRDIYHFQAWPVNCDPVHSFTHLPARSRRYDRELQNSGEWWDHKLQGAWVTE